MSYIGLVFLSPQFPRKCVTVMSVSKNYTFNTHVKVLAYYMINARTGLTGNCALTDDIESRKFGLASSLLWCWTL